MALNDLILKAKVNVALARDPRVGVLDIGVRAENGIVTLTGDVDDRETCLAAEQIARQVEGVTGVRNELTFGLGIRADTAELITQRLLEKLDEEFHRLPDQSALTQADYLRWALWLVYKFRLPAEAGDEDRAQMEAATTEKALDQIARAVGIPKALAALEMLRQAESISASPRLDAPPMTNAPLISTPPAEGAVTARA